MIHSASTTGKPVVITFSPENCFVLRDFVKCGRTDGSMYGRTTCVKIVIPTCRDCELSSWINWHGFKLRTKFLILSLNQNLLLFFVFNVTFSAVICPLKKKQAQFWASEHGGLNQNIHGQNEKSTKRESHVYCFCVQIYLTSIHVMLKKINYSEKHK